MNDRLKDKLRRALVEHERAHGLMTDDPDTPGRSDTVDIETVLDIVEDVLDGKVVRHGDR